MEKHPGIRIDKIPVKDDVGGVIFGAGVLIMILIGVPAARWFALASIPAGVVVGLVLRIARAFGYDANFNAST